MPSSRVARLHAYEVVGEVILTRSGNATRKIMHCKIIRCPVAGVYPYEDHLIVNIGVIVQGYETLHFDHWIADWNSEADNLNPDDLEAGRKVEVAIEVEALEQLITTGTYLQASRIDPMTGSLLTNSTTANQTLLGQEPYSWPIVAVRIDGQWAEPLPSEPLVTAGFNS